MGKGRMTLLDVPAAVKELRACIGHRVANIYNISGKTYQFKLKGTGTNKLYMLMESGVRVHLTKYERSKQDIPNSFAMKLRKHIRTKRLEDVKQLGTDRCEHRATSVSLAQPETQGG